MFNKHKKHRYHRPLNPVYRAVRGILAEYDARVASGSIDESNLRVLNEDEADTYARLSRDPYQLRFKRIQFYGPRLPPVRQPVRLRLPAPDLGTAAQPTRTTIPVQSPQAAPLQSAQPAPPQRTITIPSPTRQKPTPNLPSRSSRVTSPLSPLQIAPFQVDQRAMEIKKALDALPTYSPEHRIGILKKFPSPPGQTQEPEPYKRNHKRKGVKGDTLATINTRKPRTEEKTREVQDLRRHAVRMSRMNAGSTAGVFVGKPEGPATRTRARTKARVAIPGGTGFPFQYTAPVVVDMNQNLQPVIPRQPPISPSRVLHQAGNFIGRGLGRLSDYIDPGPRQ